MGRMGGAVGGNQIIAFDRGQSIWTSGILSFTSKPYKIFFSKKKNKKIKKIKNEHFPPCRISDYPLKYDFKDGVGRGSYDALILMPFFSMI